MVKTTAIPGQAELFGNPVDERALRRATDKEFRQLVVSALRTDAFRQYQRLGYPVSVWELVPEWRRLAREAKAAGRTMARTWIQQAFPEKQWRHVGYTKGPLNDAKTAKTFVPAVVMDNPAAAALLKYAVPPKSRPDTNDA